MLRSYLDTLDPVNTADPGRYEAGDEQYTQWVVENTHAAGITDGSETMRPSEAAEFKPLQVIKPSLNGIAYIPDYKDWEVISTMHRWDNGTLRAILGNAIAVRAVKKHHTNPWPDGTQFAKVAWDAVLDSTGQVHAGMFKQVEFMIKDSHKYAETEGWKWARWRGTDLKPYGKTATFMTECTSCHKPMKDFDYVFTMPRNLGSDIAAGDSLGAGQTQTSSHESGNDKPGMNGNSSAGKNGNEGLGTNGNIDRTLNPLDWKIITSSVNKVEAQPLPDLFMKFAIHHRLK